MTTISLADAIAITASFQLSVPLEEVQVLYLLFKSDIWRRLELRADYLVY